jgi:hypothetical protein
LCSLLVSVDILRLGTVEQLLTPAATDQDQRFSRHLSFGASSLVAEIGDADADMDFGVSPVVTESSQPTSTSSRAMRAFSSSSLIPPRSAHTDHTRSSFLTSGSGTSRMSGLSDFPIPPDHLGEPRMPQPQSPTRSRARTRQLSPERAEDDDLADVTMVRPPPLEEQDPANRLTTHTVDSVYSQ